MTLPLPAIPAPTHRASRLARLQQCTVVLTAILVAVWLAWFWNGPGAVAAAGVLLLVFGYALVLALEFVAVHRVNRGDAVAAAGRLTLAQAWWQEVRVALQVFSWRQPFLWRRCPDEAVPPAPGLTAVVLVHGFVCNRGLWLPWMRELLRRGMPYTSVNLEPVFGSIDDYIPLVDDAVRRAQALTGRPPVLVCHSMGGLAARAWCAATPDAHARVRRVITIGSPHHGTWLGRFSRMPNGRQMCQQGAWLVDLQSREAALAPANTYARFTCWYSNADNIVFPASTAMLPGADNRHVPGVAHVALAFHPRVMAETLAWVASVRDADTSYQEANGRPLRP
ncbi:esterase/lipase family protein [Hydrogenophaga sp. SL48]|uniref:esterase/lipase family protein n=1 Tax=Hydrogenophaga sp. SL48 TaxID=2806347 RepID=UPI001F188127|nr:alpha/beta fold hydrolase [Hydrogenophaga sp. SL48]UJW80984.1 alpha/beta fold hydrolase [Hydrogenophaga sp. SL48]